MKSCSYQSNTEVLRAHLSKNPLTLNGKASALSCWQIITKLPSEWTLINLHLISKFTLEKPMNIHTSHVRYRSLPKSNFQLSSGNCSQNQVEPGIWLSVQSDNYQGIVRDISQWQGPYKFNYLDSSYLILWILISLGHKVKQERED